MSPRATALTVVTDWIQELENSTDFRAPAINEKLRIILNELVQAQQSRARVLSHTTSLDPDLVKYMRVGPGAIDDQFQKTVATELAQAVLKERLITFFASTDPTLRMIRVRAEVLVLPPSVKPVDDLPTQLTKLVGS